MLASFPLAMFAAQGIAASDQIPGLVTTVCHACHMSDGNSIVPTFPKLAGQQAHYLEKQLNEWRLGRRNIDAMAAFLPQVTAAAVRDLAEYYASQTRTPGTVLDPAPAARGETVYLDGNEDSGVPACEACDQWEGQGNERYPRLAGQRGNSNPEMIEALGRHSEAEVAAACDFVSRLSAR